MVSDKSRLVIESNRFTVRFEPCRISDTKLVRNRPSMEGVRIEHEGWPRPHPAARIAVVQRERGRASCSIPTPSIDGY